MLRGSVMACSPEMCSSHLLPKTDIPKQDKPPSWRGQHRHRLLLIARRCGLEGPSGCTHRTAIGNELPGTSGWSPSPSPSPSPATRCCCASAPTTPTASVSSPSGASPSSVGCCSMCCRRARAHPPPADQFSRAGAARAHTSRPLHRLAPPVDPTRPIAPLPAPTAETCSHCYPGPPPEYFMALPFGTSAPRGEVVYHAAFDSGV
jgi:hypothetical protein